VLWDFDGTLAVRPGHWGACLIEVLDAHSPSHGVTFADLVPLLRTGFLWHAYRTPHPQLSEPGAWWAHMEQVLLRVLTGAAVPAGVAVGALRGFRAAYLDPGGWKVLPGAARALELTAAGGWRNVIVSNHAPELPALMGELGLADHVHEVICSAACGYEKPHPAIFELGRRAGGGSAVTWMVGDNPVADIAGAARAGIPGILIRDRPVDEDFADWLRESFDGEDWSDWPGHCRITAPTAEAAAVRILGG
jgi:putative hydrolase of the HAD superfamily